MSQLHFSTMRAFRALSIAVALCSSLAGAAQVNSSAKKADASPPVHHGVIIAHAPPHPQSGFSPIGVLELIVSPGPNCVGDLSVTEGEQPHQQTIYDLRQHYSCSFFGENLVVGIDPPMGRTPPWWTLIRVVVADWPAPRRPLPNGQHYEKATQTLTATTPVTNPAASQGIAVTQYVMIRP